MAAKCLKCVRTFRRFKGNYFGRRGKFCQSTTAFFLLVIYSHQEIAAGNAHFGVSKSCLSCQYKFVMCSAVLSFLTQNAFGRAQAALVILSEETLGVLPLITFLLLESPRWGKRGDRWIVVRSFGCCCCCQNKRASVELCTWLVR